MDTNADDAFADLANDLADTREHQPFALITGRSPRTALRRFARALGLPEYASVAVLNEVEADRTRGHGVYRDIYTPYVPTLATVLRGRWTWPEVKWERSHGRWAFTDDVPASEIIAVARRYVRYVVFVDDVLTRIYDGTIDAAELERRLAVRGPYILTRAAEPERMPVLVQIEVASNGAADALTSVPIRDRVVAPGLVAEMLATLRHFGANAREYVRLVVPAAPSTDS